MKVIVEVDLPKMQRSSNSGSSVKEKASYVVPCVGGLVKPRNPHIGSLTRSDLKDQVSLIEELAEHVNWLNEHPDWSALQLQATREAVQAFRIAKAVANYGQPTLPKVSVDLGEPDEGHPVDGEAA